ncbi:MAG TPA: rRNA maturation RNase YbeY [Chthoniobacterales bacterium]|jgi:probable rRNA maturation factor
MKRTESKRRRPRTSPAPAISVHNRQRAIRIEIVALKNFANRILLKCLEISAPSPSGLRKLEEINLLLVSDRRIAELHRRFLSLPGPTDVITFQHGEIFISTERARAQARRFGTSIDEEIRLYLTHGLLHLHGFDDKKSPDAAKMARVQAKLMNSLR